MIVSIRKNYFYQLLYQFVTLLIPLITTPYLARVLGVSHIGMISYTLSIVSYFVVFGSVGVSSYGQREIAMARDDKKKVTKIFWELFFYKCFTSFLSFCLYLGLIFTMKDTFTIMLILSFHILSSLLDISWLYQGLEEYQYISIRNIVVKILFTISIFVFIRNAHDVVLYVFLYMLSLLFSSLSLWIRLPKLLVKIKFGTIHIFSHWKNTLIYFLPQIATSIYTMLDQTMLGILTGSKVENGLYEQAHKIIQISLMVITSFNTIMTSRMSYLFQEKKWKEMKEKLLKSLQFASFLCIPMCFGMIGIAHGFVPWFFGAEYEKVSILLPLFSPILIAISLSNCLGSQCLTPCGKRGKSAMVLWIGAILNFITNLLFIPRLGSVGAVLASLLAEWVITILYFYLSREYISFVHLLHHSWYYFASGFFMLLVVLGVSTLLPIHFLTTLLEITLGVSVYLILLIWWKEPFVGWVLKELKTYVQKKE